MTAIQAQPPTILIVDDDFPIVSLCKAFLEEAGFAVLGTDGSSEALKICTQHKGPIDLLLTDLVLPPPGFQLASATNQFPTSMALNWPSEQRRFEAGSASFSCQEILKRSLPPRDQAGHISVSGKAIRPRPAARPGEKRAHWPATTLGVEKPPSVEIDAEWFG